MPKPKPKPRPPRVKTPSLLRAFEAYLDGKPISECARVCGTSPDALSRTIVSQGWEAMRRELLAEKLSAQKRNVETLADAQRQATARHLSLSDQVICEAEATLDRLRITRNGKRGENVRDLARLSAIVAEMVRTQRLSLNLDTERLTTQTQADSLLATIREFMEGDDPQPPTPPEPAAPATDGSSGPAVA